MRRFSLAMVGIAMAALVTMVSCRKPQLLNDNTVAPRTMTFNAKTEMGGWKTSLDGLDVNWSAGDQLCINGESFTLSSGAGTTFGGFTSDGEVSIESPYYAAYPASATYDAGTLTFNLSATPAYDATEVAIPMVAVNYSELTTLYFKNVVNVLKLKLKGVDTDASKLTSIVLTSTTSKLNGDVAVTFDGNTPVVGTANGTKTTTLSFGEGLQLTSTETKYVYVVLPKIDGGDLKIRFTCANEEYIDKEIAMTSDFNAVNNMLTAPEFTVNAVPAPVEDDWINFNDEAMGVTGLPIWSKKNIGATNGSTAQSWYGDYYAWGATTTWYEDGTASSPTWKSGYSGGYIVANAPYYSGSAYTKYYSGDGKMVLDEADDAAQEVLGSSWRMPKADDWKNLFKNTYFKWVYGYNGIEGLNGFVVYKVKNADDKGLMTLYYEGDWYTFDQEWDEAELKGEYGPTDPHIFLPAAGSFNETILQDPGSEGYYWSRSRSSDPNFAKAMNFMSYEVDPCDETDYTRNCGMSVRPVR